MSIHESVKAYYGRVLKNNGDLITDACCTSASLPPALQAMADKVHPDVRARYYGCGIVMPELLDGLQILDLGCGAGHDCFILAQLVGPRGRVTGIDMTTEQIELARRFETYHQEQFGYPRPNTRFMRGYLEELEVLPLEPNSIDVIVSNCVLNLSPDKSKVLQGAYRLLKEGGEMYFADVYASRRIPPELAEDEVLYGECLAGALYWNDFLAMARQAGFRDPRLVDHRPVRITDDDAQQKLGGIEFHSATFRLFKLSTLELACENYGQAVRYLGSIAHHPSRLQLDKHHDIEAGCVFPVCGNTYRMLNETRFRDYFNFYGSWERHFGILPGCGIASPFDEPSGASTCC